MEEVRACDHNKFIRQSIKFIYLSLINISVSIFSRACDNFLLRTNRSSYLNLELSESNKETSERMREGLVFGSEGKNKSPGSPAGSQTG